MIDGVKIECSGISPNDWLKKRKYLKFYTQIDPETSEVLNDNIHAKYRGLLFQIKRSTIKAGKYHFIVSGSLHKYYNNGKHNADNFTTDQLKEVLKDLHKKFNIDPETAYLRSFEFGANIHTPAPTKEILKGLVAYKGYNFSMLKIDGKQNGKQIKRQRSQAKIYDKAKQYSLPDKNLMRFEIAVKKMEYVKPYNIRMLSDLTDPDKLQPLKALLLGFWQNVIYYDKKVKYKELTNFEQKKLLYYASPRNWTDFTRKQRYRAKKHFISLLNKVSISKTYTQISILLSDKLDELTAKKCPQINQLFDPNFKPDLSTFEPLKYRVKTYTNKNNKKVLNFCPKTKNQNPDFSLYVKPYNPKARKCKVCNKDISHKKANAVYCSKQCNNKYNGKRRTQKRQKQKATELKHLDRLLTMIDKNRLWLAVSYKDGGALYCDYLHQSEITTSPDIIKQVTEVTITGHRKNAKPITLTSYRARKLLKHINIKNLKI